MRDKKINSVWDAQRMELKKIEARLDLEIQALDSMRTEANRDFEILERCKIRDIDRAEVQIKILEDQYEKALNRYEERVGWREAMRTKENNELVAEIDKKIMLEKKYNSDKKELEALKK